MRSVGALAFGFSQYHEGGTFTRGEEFVDSIPGFSGLGYSRSASSFLEGGNGIWMPEGQTHTAAATAATATRTHVDLIGSRERAHINKIYLGWNTGILYRVEIEAGTPRR